MHQPSQPGRHSSGSIFASASWDEVVPPLLHTNSMAGLTSQIHCYNLTGWLTIFPLEFLSFHLSSLKCRAWPRKVLNKHRSFKPALPPEECKSGHFSTSFLTSVSREDTLSDLGCPPCVLPLSQRSSFQLACLHTRYQTSKNTQR